MNHRYGNALVFYGGGLCDCAAFYISQLAQRLSQRGLFEKTYVGFYSFRCLTEKGLIKEWNQRMYEKTINVFGGYFGTARKIDLASDTVLLERAITCCKQFNIKWIFLAGGDGSSRQMAEIHKHFEQEGIKFCFTMPMTIDGIEGGKAFGINSAVEASLHQIETVSSTTLRTLDENKYPGIVFELQGRNRDDILANVIFELYNTREIADFQRDEVQIIGIPANMDWSEERLRARLHVEENPYQGEILGKPTIILLSEGATISKKQIVELAKEEGMKFRTFSIGHFSQINGLTDEDEKEIIIATIEESVSIIEDYVVDESESFTLVLDDCNFLDVRDANYFADLNPRKNQRATLEPKLQHILEMYLP